MLASAQVHGVLRAPKEVARILACAKIDSTLALPRIPPHSRTVTSFASRVLTPSSSGRPSMPKNNDQISPLMQQLSTYIATALRRKLPPGVVERAKRRLRAAAAFAQLHGLFAFRPSRRRFRAISCPSLARHAARRSSASCGISRRSPTGAPCARSTSASPRSPSPNLIPARGRDRGDSRIQTCHARPDCRAATRSDGASTVASSACSE